MPPVLSEVLAPAVPAVPKVPSPPAIPSRPAPLTSALAPEVSRRRFADSKAMRQAVLDGVINAVGEKYPLENVRYRLEARDLKYKSAKSPFTLTDQKRAIMQGQSLDRQLTGEWALVDKSTGDVVDRKRGLIAHVPAVTPRGTFIYRGNEYTVANQMRLKPGVFTRVKENGIIEAHVNVKPGTGPSFRVHMEPQTGIFRLNVGQSSLKLYPILKAMGVSDRELEQTWGSNLLQANIAAEDPRAVQRAFAKLVSIRADQPAQDDETEKKVAAAVMCTLEEALQMVDADMVKEAADESHAPTVAIDLDGTIAEQYKGFDADNIPKPRRGVRKALEEFKAKGWKVIIWTCRGKDEVTKAYLEEHKIPYDHINENPDQKDDMSQKVVADLYIDDKGMEAKGPWHEIKERAIKALEKTAKIGARESDLRWRKLWFRGTIKAETGKDGKPWVCAEVHRGLLDAALDSIKSEGFNVERSPNEPHITVIRTKELEPVIKKHKNQWQGAAKNGQPVRFALKRIVHLVPNGWKDVDRVWFIEVESPELIKYRKDLGLPGLPQADDGTDNRFHITFAVSKPKAEIKRAYEELVEKRAAEGVFEYKPTNEHGQGLFSTFSKMELDPDVTQSTLGEPFERADIPMFLRTTKKLLNIQKGEEEVDDRDSLAYQTIHSPEDFFAERIRKDAGQIGRKLLWRSTLRGNVQHVPSGALSPQLRGVLLRSGMGMPLEEINPMDVFDQHLRVLRLGEGGIPCHSRDTEVLTAEGWKSWDTVTEDDALATEIDGRLDFRRPVKIIRTHYEGPMLLGVTDRVDYLVTPNHRMYVRHKTAKHDWSEFSFRTAEDLHGVRVRHMIATGPFIGGERLSVFVLDPAPVEKSNPGSQNLEPRVFDFLDWVELLGYYLADGSFCYNLDRKEYRVEIGKKRDKNLVEYELIEALLTRMGIPHRYEQGRRFIITGKEFAHYFSQFGKSREKFLPEMIMRGDLEVRRVAFEALTRMDHSGKYEEGHILYASASERLRDQAAFLAITLGYSVTYRTRLKEFCNPSYQVLCRDAQEAGVMLQKHGQQYQTVDYKDYVFCADMGGGLLLTRRNGKVLWSGNSLDAVPDEARNVQPSHFGYIDPIRAPESAKIGVDARVTHGSFKGGDGRIYTSMTNARTGKSEYVPADTAANSVVAFPGEMGKKGGRVRAMVRAKQVEYVNKKDVDYELSSHNRMFSASSNLVPLISGIKGGRLLMGAKFMSQALPLRNAESPLVQNLSDIEGRSFDDLYGERVGAIRAEQNGVVTAMDKNGVTVRYKDGTKETHELYNNFPFNRKTFIHNTPTVKIGDRFKTGALLARSNYTDADGTLAIGTNLRTAYMPYKGLNYEDAVVISESAAKRLSSEHMYQHALDMGEADKELGRNAFVSILPSKFSRAQMGTINTDGVVKVGTSVKHGDPLVLALNKTKSGGVHRGHKPIYMDGSVTWNHESEGVVTDVDRTKDGGWNVTVKAYMPSQEGDKLAGRYGDKGVISKIIPDSQMPQNAQGQPFDLLLNPLGVISRGNPSQIYETLLGKVARVEGKPLKVPSFMDENLIDFVKARLQRNRLSDTEDLVDPETNRKIPKILTGERFIMKLHHTAESKGRGRDVGAYTSEGLPAKGGEFGAKRISNMEINSLISHGATDVLRDAAVVRGQRNDDFWRAFRLGLTPPSPKTPFIYEKFLSHLKGAGINVKKDGSSLQLFALTDKDIEKISAGAIKNAKTVVGDQLKIIPGGLFDEGLTGGHGGNRWSHIRMSEPVPNPIMEEPIRRLLGMTQKQYEDVISGEQEIDGQVGGNAVRKALSKIKIPSAMEYYKGVIKDGPRSKRDNAVKVLGYLKTLKKAGMRPEDFVLTKVPVIPPSMRPVTMYREMPLHADANFLYHDLLLANKDLGTLKGVVGGRRLQRERLRVYNAFKAVAGLGDPVFAKTQEKKVRGLLAHVFGSSPKLGMFQRRVLGAPVDVVGRATITPNPELNMDQVGLPETKAWIIYRPFITRRLVRRGMPATEAAKAVANQSEVARKAMLEEMEDRPVIINRAPTLHRYGFMAAWPVLTKGNTLQVSPVVTPGFNADFDGDAMNYHVPVDDDAVQDAIERMMPSRNLKAVRDFQVHYTPKQEFLLGLYLATTAKNKNKQPRVFRSKADAIAAYQRGDLGVGDPVVVKDES